MIRFIRIYGTTMITSRLNRMLFWKETFKCMTWCKLPIRYPYLYFTRIKYPLAFCINRLNIWSAFFTISSNAIYSNLEILCCRMSKVDTYLMRTDAVATRHAVCFKRKIWRIVGPLMTVGGNCAVKTPIKY